MATCVYIPSLAAFIPGLHFFWCHLLLGFASLYLGTSYWFETRDVTLFSFLLPLGAGAIYIAAAATVPKSLAWSRC